jgi:AraC-like DNA-binding protein
MRVSSMHVRALLEAIQPAGVSLATLFARAELHETRLTSDTTWFSLEEFDRLMSCALTLTGDEALGLHWGERAPIMQYDLLSVLIAQAPSLQNAIAALLRFQTIFADQPELSLRESTGSARRRTNFVCEPLACSVEGFRVRSEVLVTAMVRFLRDVGWSARPAIRRVAFKHERPAQPAHAAEYERMFAGLARFEQPEYGVEFEYAELNSPEPAANAELHSILEVQAERLLSRARAELGFCDQVRALLERTLPRVPDMQEAARVLSLSERSLRRRLADEGSSYSELVEQTQSALAQRWLSDPTKSLKEVAYVLGFANASSFHRAFKRWTGTSPAAFRLERLR